MENTQNAEIYVASEILAETNYPELKNIANEKITFTKEDAEKFFEIEGIGEVFAEYVYDDSKVVTIKELVESVFGVIEDWLKTGAHVTITEELVELAHKELDTLSSQFKNSTVYESIIVPYREMLIEENIGDTLVLENPVKFVESQIAITNVVYEITGYYISFV